MIALSIHPNLSLFEKENVQVIGIIANKVLPAKLEQTKLAGIVVMDE